MSTFIPWTEFATEHLTPDRGNAMMKTKWTKVDDAAVLLVFACPECGLAETFNPCEQLVTTGTPVCPECDCDMDYTHVCLDYSRLGEVCTDNDGQTVIYTGRHVAGRKN